MAITFNKKSWKSRISEHPTRRRLTIVDASLGYSLVDVARDEGTVEQVGDTFDKSTMDDLESRIEAGFTSAQDSVDNLQEQIDDLPSIIDVKNIDIGRKESGTRNVSGDTIKVNPFELFSGTVGTGKNKFKMSNANQTATVDGVTLDYDALTDEYEFTGTNTNATNHIILTMTTLFACDLKPNTTYTMSKTSSQINTVYITLSYSDGTTTKYETMGGASRTFTTASAVLNPQIRIGIYGASTTIDESFNLQIEEGSSATAYEQFSKVINGFIPSAKFFQMGRAFMQEKPVKEFREELNPYYEGAILNVTKDRFYSLEDVDTQRVSDVKTMYGYDYVNEQFLTSVAGEIYTATGSISCDLQVTDIWGCGGNGASYYHSDTTVPVEPINRNTTNANGFPIELMPTNQSAVASLVVGSPVQFRITGELYILLQNGFSLREYTEGMRLSKFHNFVPWTDTRDGIHYAKHFIDIEKGTTFNLSSITTLINYHFEQASVDDPDLLDYISWTVTDSNIAITGDDYATGIVLHIDQRKDGETEPEYDTAEDIIINVI